MITRKIELHEDTTESQFHSFENWLDGLGKLLGSYEEEGTYFLVVGFDDDMDYLAFSCVVSGLDMEVVQHES